jgi:tetratricopeptide (TPR) repeat protein
VSLSVAAQIESPKLTPVESTENQARLIKEGIALHDNKNYDAAIKKYEEVLKENPDNLEAIYEMGFSYSEKQDYKQSLEIAYRGARYKSPLVTGFYVLAGNSLDHLGQPEKAIEVYKAGIKLQPNVAMLHYNLGITYRNNGKSAEARKSFKKAVSLNANQASSHLALGNLFYSEDYKTPALLALSRFLVLEPNSTRSDDAYKIVMKILQGGVTKGEGNQINIVVGMSGKKDEGDFGPADLALGLSSAVDSIEENKGKTKAQLAVEQLQTFFAILSEQNSKDKRSKFVWAYYIPYFGEMKDKNHVEPFYYYISRRSSDPDVKKWLDDNYRRVNEFLNWSKQYQWPRVED